MWTFLLVAYLHNRLGSHRTLYVDGYVPKQGLLVPDNMVEAMLSR